MSASVISRFAKIITAVAGRRRDSVWAPRLAVSVPLAAIVAVGAVGCSAPKSATAAGQPSATPSVASSAPVSPSAVPSASPSDAAPASPSAAPTSAPTTPAERTTRAAQAARTTAPVQPVGHKSAGAPVAVEFEGLAEGQKLSAGGGPVSFSVTWTNTTGHRLDAVAPVVVAQPFAGARCQVVEGMVQGTLQRNDGGSWKDLPISQGTDVGFAFTGNDAAFPLAAGASRTVQYRMTPAADNGPAPLVVEADAFVPSRRDVIPLGQVVRHLTVVDDHRPTASMPSMTPIPTAVTAGGPAVEVEVSPGNLTKAPFASLAPLLTLSDSSNGVQDSMLLLMRDVTVEVGGGDAGWRKLPLVDDCGKVRVDTSSLAAPLENGPYGRVHNYTFRFSISSAVSKDITSLDVSAGALADGHYAQPVTTKVAVKRLG